MITPHSQYSEAVIVGLVSDIYKMLLQLGYVQEHEMIWPPPGGHQLDFSLLDDSSRIDLRVISLMQHLPLIADRTKTVAPCMRPVNYLNPHDLAISRDLDKKNFWAPSGESRIDMANAEPTVLQLLCGEESPDSSLVLDLSDNSIRKVAAGYDGEFEDDYTRSEPDPGRLEAYVNHYMNWPKEDAPTYLKRMLQHYRDVKWVPDYVGGIITTDSETEPWCAGLRRELQDDYGWPDNFKEAEWKRDSRTVLAKYIGRG